MDYKTPDTDNVAQVLRYSALCLGVFYGFYHQRSITSAQKAVAAQREYEHKQKLIDQAKAEYAKTKQPASATVATSKSGGELTSYLASYTCAPHDMCTTNDGTVCTVEKTGLTRPLPGNLASKDPSDPNFDLGAYLNAFLSEKS